MGQAQASCAQAKRTKQTEKERIICPHCGHSIPKAMKNGSGVLLDYSRFPNWLKDMFEDIEDKWIEFLRSHPQLVIWQQFFQKKLTGGIQLDYIPILCGLCKRNITIRS